MNKGFTLIELLTVIALIAILYLIFFPTTIEHIRRTGQKIDAANQIIIFDQTKKYLSDNPYQYPKVEGNVYCIELQDLIYEGYLGDYLYDGTTKEKFDYQQMIKVVYDEEFQFEIVDPRFCEEIIEEINFIDQSGATQPKLMGAMIPVIYNGGWITISPTEEWYDYNQKQWANVVLIYPQKRDLYLDVTNVMIDDNDIMAHFVWIPRYRYKLFNSEKISLTNRTIDIKFEKDSEYGVEEWLTHPAFTVNDSLDGFWVGKFSTTGNRYVPTILGNQTMLIDLVAKNQYDAAKLIGINDYGITGESRMMRNLEWGAIAYLSHSKYGHKEIWINPNQDYITGCAYLERSSEATEECDPYYSTNGGKASTTGNVYGVYDMSGGTWERVLGALANQDGSIMGLSSGFTTELTNQTFIDQVDVYDYSLDDDSFERSHLGDAMGESYNWYENYAMMPHDDNKSWVIRGGDYTLTTSSGIFAFAADNGGSGARSFRIVIPGN